MEYIINILFSILFDLRSKSVCVTHICKYTQSWRLLFLKQTSNNTIYYPSANIFIIMTVFKEHHRVVPLTSTSIQCITTPSTSGSLHFYAITWLTTNLIFLETQSLGPYWVYDWTISYWKQNHIPFPFSQWF